MAKLETIQKGQLDWHIPLNRNMEALASLTDESIFLLCHPVGSCWINTTKADPNQLYGGTWERMALGRTLVGVDENDTDFDETGKRGGEKEHILTVSEMPSHRHTSKGLPLGTDDLWAEPHNRTVYKNTANNPYPNAAATNNAGGNEAHNNMPPFETVNIWKRTA